jgi:hypothetical protein
MSKVQGKDSELQNNLTGTGIVSELDSLDSHLRDLEKNIAVAREFIKLADESYSELRHKWNLIQEEARNKTGTGISEKATSASKKRRLQTDALAEPEENVVSKTEELVGDPIEKTPRSDKSKSRSKHERGQKPTKDSEETTHSAGQLDNAKPSKEHGPKHRRDKARPSTN